MLFGSGLRIIMLRRAAPIVAFTILLVGALTHANAGSAPASRQVARSIPPSAVVPALLTRPEPELEPTRRIEVSSDQGAACPGEMDGELMQAAFSSAEAEPTHINPYIDLLSGPAPASIDQLKRAL